MEEVKITFLFPKEERHYLRLLCAKLGVTMKHFITKTLIEKIEDMEDEFLAKQALKTLQRIETGEEKTTPFSEFKKTINQCPQKKLIKSKSEAKQKSLCKKSKKQTRRTI